MITQGTDGTNDYECSDCGTTWHAYGEKPEICPECASADISEMTLHDSQIGDMICELRLENESLNGEKERLKAKLAALKEAARWIPVSEKLPEFKYPGWSSEVQLAYKIHGCKYNGQQCVSRYYRNVHREGLPDWEYNGKTLREYGYEAVAWRPLPQPPEVEEVEE